MATVEARWKELLIWKNDSHTLIFEMTMGVMHIYLPTREAWLKAAPVFAQQRYDEICDDIRAWATASNIPITFDDIAWVETE